MHDRPTKTFCCHYRHLGQDWAVSIEADSWQDVRARLATLRGLKLDGELYKTIPAGNFPRVTKVLVVAWVALLNIKRTLLKTGD